MDAKQIKKIRKALNLSQQEFAAKLKIARGTVADWEREKNKPSFKLRARIRRLYKKNGSRAGTQQTDDC